MNKEEVRKKIDLAKDYNSRIGNGEVFGVIMNDNTYLEREEYDAYNLNDEEGLIVMKTKYGVYCIKYDEIREIY